MPITYGKNLAKTWGAVQRSGTVLMKAYTTYSEVSDVFLSYRQTGKPPHGTWLTTWTYEAYVSS